MNKNNKLNKKNKTINILLIIFISIFILFISSTIFSILNMNSTEILQGISINGIDVSKMKKNEAIEYLNKIIEEKIKNNIELKYVNEENNYVSNINLNNFDVQYDVTKAVNEAYSIGRSGNIFQNNYQILKNILVKTDLNIEKKYSKEKLNSLIENISSNLPNALIQSSYYIEENKLIITRGSSGLIINKDDFLEKINIIINNIKEEINEINIPTINKNPEEIDIQKIYNEMHKEPQNAYYEENPFKIYPEINGIDFDINLAKEKLKEVKDEYEIELISTSPDIKIENLDIDIFKEVLSTYITRYDVTNEERTTNLKLATEKIDGIVLAPNEEFSYNKTVGARTIEAGYKEAKIYQNGQVIDGIGGGICQISSTLYNAVVMANLEVTDRRNHQFTTSYIDPGRDATVAYGSQDFKFKNTRKYPIKIVAKVLDGIVKISVYGIKEDIEYDIDFEVTTINKIPHNIRYIENNSLNKGERLIKQTGIDGIVTQTYKITKLNGSIVSRILISTDTYNSLEEIILIGK